MGSEKQEESMKTIIQKDEEEEEKRAKEEMWKYIFGFTEMAVLKCAVELGIPDILATHGRPMTVLDLTSALASDSELTKVDSRALARIMRFLSNRGIFRSSLTYIDGDLSQISYAQTALSRRFASSQPKCMTPLLLLESSPVMLAPWLALASFVAYSPKRSTPFEMAHGKDLWVYAGGDRGHNGLINEAMACFVRETLGAMVEECPVEEIFGLGFGGKRVVVDVGGGNGTAMKMVVKACPVGTIRATNFDLPHVVAAVEAEEDEGDFEGVLDYVAGDMFEFVPKADVAFISSVLHDWSDEDCIRILKNCREAIPKDTGKIVLVEVLLQNSDNENKLKDVGLFLDMVMMAHTTLGKERTFEEWAYVLRQAGFGSPTVRSISAVQSVIEAFPASS